MSRYNYPGKGVASSVAIGWDRPLATFFVQIMQPHPRIDREEATYIWRGTEPGELPTAASAIAVAAEYADLPKDLGAMLETDRLSTLGTFNGPAQQAVAPFLMSAPAQIRTEQDAREAGFTVAIVADSSVHSLELLVAPDTDYDSTFTAFDCAQSEMLEVNGWNFIIQPEDP